MHKRPVVGNEPRVFSQHTKINKQFWQLILRLFCAIRTLHVPYIFVTRHEPDGVLTRWGREKMDAISQTSFSNGFSWIKIYEFRLKFQLVSRGPSNSVPALVDAKPLSEPMIVYVRIYASLGHNDLDHRPLDFSLNILFKPIHVTKKMKKFRITSPLW